MSQPIRTKTLDEVLRENTDLVRQNSQDFYVFKASGNTYLRKHTREGSSWVPIIDGILRNDQRIASGGPYDRIAELLKREGVLS